MIIKEGNLPLERAGQTGKDNQFKIAATAKAFEILSSGIYKNAIRAIVRELGTNAADSHKMAGKPTAPFEVSLPNNMQPWFSIKDSGVGLTPNQIMSVYTTYFASDKTHTNELTGCLGLGSKSPFSYTDQFTIASVTNGVKRSYVAFIDASGAPNLTQQGTDEPTDEPTGVEIKFSVKASDFRTFAQEASEVYRWFDPQPKVDGLNTWGFSLEKDDIVLKGDRWSITEALNGPMVILMGNVGYPVHRHELSANFFDHLHELSKEMIQLGPILKVDIGEVDITASREGLKFTDKTHKTIRARLAEVVAGCRAECKRAIADAPTLWDARLTLRNLQRSRHLERIIEKEGAEWHGKKVHTNIKVRVMRPNPHFKPNDKDTITPPERKVSRAFVRSYSHGRYRRGKYSTNVNEGVERIEIDENVRLFVNDLPKGHIARIEHYFRSRNSQYQQGTEGGGTIYLIEESPGFDGTYKLEDFFAEEEIGDHIEKTSSLPAPPPAMRGSYQKSAQVLKLSSSNPYIDRDAWKETTNEDFDAGGVYVDVTGYIWSAGNFMTGQKPDALSKLLQSAQPLLKIDWNDIVGVRSSWRKRFEKHEAWERLDDYINRITKDLESVKVTAAKGQIWHRFGGLINKDGVFGFGSDGRTEIPERSPFRKYAVLVNEIYNASKDKKANALLAVQDTLRIKLPDVDDLYNKLVETDKQIAKRYPLLRHVVGCIRAHVPHERDGLVEYVNMIDRAISRGSRSSTSEQLAVAG